MAELSRAETIAKNVDELHRVVAARKELEQQEKALKDWFKEDAKFKDAIFTAGSREVVLTLKAGKLGWDTTALKAKLGKTFAKFQKRGAPSLEVTVRTKSDAVA